VRNTEFRPDFYPCEGEQGDSAAGLLADCGKRTPLIDVFYYRYAEEEYANWMLFLSRQRDVAGIPREAFEKVVTPGKELTDQWRKRQIDLRIDTDPAVYWIVFNMEDSLLGASKALRRAMCLSFDVESEIEVLYNGRGKRAVNVVPSGFRGHDEAGAGPYARFDTAAARVMLVKAKEELGAAGRLVNGEIPELRFDLADGASALRMAEFCKQQFSQIGLKVKPIFNDWPTLQRKVNNKQSQMYTMGWHADYPDAENFLQLYYSGNIDKGTNNSNFRDQEFDRLYEQVRVMMDSPERTALYVRMIQILNEECPVLLLSEPVGFTLFYPWALNNKHHPIGYGFGKYLNIDTKMRAAAGGRS
jgi:ABC-type transport system substrate-binding protein